MRGSGRTGLKGSRLSVMTRPQRRRFLIGLVGALVAGAVSTVGVSWALVIRDAYSSVHYFSFDDPETLLDGRWHCRLYRRGLGYWLISSYPIDAQSASMVSMEKPFPIPHWSLAGRADLGKSASSIRGLEYGLVEAGAGLPWVALVERVEDCQSPEHCVRLAGIHIDRARAPAIVLPTSPAPIGFAADTAFYGAAWWLVFVTPGWVRRRWRSRRGGCRRCGYDLRGLNGAVCPECGLAPPVRA